MKLTDKQINIISLLKSNSLTKDSEGKYYYAVPTSKRRSGRMSVTQREVDILVNKGFIKAS